MSTETIVAVYDTASHAQEAVTALRAAGVPNDSITVHSGRETGSDEAATSDAPAREPGFWSSLFGGDTGHDHTVYTRSMESGSTVVSVKVAEERVTRVSEILEKHSPIDIDERATGYGLKYADVDDRADMASGRTGNAAAGAAAGMAAAGTAAAGKIGGAVASGTSAAGTGAVGTGASARLPAATPVMSPVAAARTDVRPATDDGILQLSEESLSVGKRVVNRGGTRIRRYVVETPVEEKVSLHSEKVVLERHAVTDGRAVADSFSDRTIEMTETVEEAVVSKSAHVYEEVGLRKEIDDRVETVRDTVRKEEVEIEQIPAGSTKTSGAIETPRPPKT